MLLAEELVLIALDPQTGRVPISSQEYLRLGVSAALLAELALDGRVQIQGDRVVVVAGEAPADPLLAADVRLAATGQGPLGARQAVLLALAGPCRLLERVAPDRSQHRKAKARVKEATRSAPFAPEVKRIIDDMVAAAAVGAVVVSASS